MQNLSSAVSFVNHFRRALDIKEVIKKMLIIGPHTVLGKPVYIRMKN
jgi:hypothetical protein